MATTQPTYDDILRLFQQTDKKFQETDRKIKELAISIGRLGNRLGDFSAVRLFRERGS